MVSKGLVAGTCSTWRRCCTDTATAPATQAAAAPAATSSALSPGLYQERLAGASGSVGQAAHLPGGSSMSAPAGGAAPNTATASATQMAVTAPVASSSAPSPDLHQERPAGGSGLTGTSWFFCFFSLETHVLLPQKSPWRAGK